MLCACLSATELNPMSAGTSWQRSSVVSDSQRSLWLLHTQTCTHTLGLVLTAFLSFLPSPPIPSLASRVSHCLQTFHSTVLSPCTDTTFPFNHSPCMWWHDIRPGLSFLLELSSGLTSLVYMEIWLQLVAGFHYLSGKFTFLASR